MGITLTKEEELLFKLEWELRNLNAILHDTSKRSKMGYQERERFQLNDAGFIEIQYYGPVGEKVDWNVDREKFSVRIFLPEYKQEPFRLEWDKLHGLHMNVNGEVINVEKLPWRETNASVGSMVLTPPDGINSIMHYVKHHFNIQV